MITLYSPRIPQQKHPLHPLRPNLPPNTLPTPLPLRDGLLLNLLLHLLLRLHPSLPSHWGSGTSELQMGMVHTKLVMVCAGSASIGGTGEEECEAVGGQWGTVWRRVWEVGGNCFRLFGKCAFGLEQDCKIGDTEIGLTDCVWHYLGVGGRRKYYSFECRNCGLRSHGFGVPCVC